MFKLWRKPLHFFERLPRKKLRIETLKEKRNNPSFGYRNPSMMYSKITASTPQNSSQNPISIITNLVTGLLQSLSTETQQTLFKAIFQTQHISQSV